MKLTIVKNVEFPKDIPEEYVQVWDAFLKMRAVGQLRVMEKSERAIPECFRILLSQAGAKFPLQNTVKDFVDLKQPTNRLRRFLLRGGVLDHMRVGTHKQMMSLTKAEPCCAAYNPTFVGTVVLRPQRFDLDYLIGRMQGLVYKTLPIQLSSKLPNGDARKFRKVNSLRSMDFVPIYEDKELTIQMARADKELVIRYEIKLGVIVPLYQRVDAALKGLWQKSIMGVFV